MLCGVDDSATAVDGPQRCQWAAAPQDILRAGALEPFAPLPPIQDGPEVLYALCVTRRWGAPSVHGGTTRAC